MVIGWVHIGERADLNVFSTEFDNSGSKGWDQKNDFENVMSEAQDIGTKAIVKLKANGREPADDRFNKMTAALKTHAHFPFILTLCLL
ncbi:hypothetical protein ETB97_002216 [Aspergillus alliaceus]|uniref:Uncharacterized protein n=1 Tax=Petromyces alliaceus TaxID=209559 RepID=A0A8H6A2Z3_PETAA|nr:hypothetical protein ETB97_002216 [Aspergillus burnettii]